MTKRTLTCSCGLEMQVPASAIGRNGLCPECGAEIAITEENTRIYTAPRNGAGGLLSYKKKHEVVQSNEAREESWRKFAAAVDLYNTRRYAESLTILNGLQATFPGNQHIEVARQQCLDALQLTMSDTREYDGRLVQSDYLNTDLVRSVVLDKLLNGASEDVQLQAAALAANMLGMFPGAAAPAPPPSMTQLPAPEDFPGLPEPEDAIEEPPAMLLTGPAPPAMNQKPKRRGGKPKAKKNRRAKR